MAGYDFVFSQAAQTQIAELDSVTRKRLGKKLQYFVSSCRPLSSTTQLVNVDPTTYRFRVGKYRIFFETTRQTRYILAIKRRDQAYKKL